MITPNSKNSMLNVQFGIGEWLQEIFKRAKEVVPPVIKPGKKEDTNKSKDEETKED